ERSGYETLVLPRVSPRFVIAIIIMPMVVVPIIVMMPMVVPIFVSALACHARPFARFMALSAHADLLSDVVLYQKSVRREWTAMQAGDNRTLCTPCRRSGESGERRRGQAHCCSNGRPQKRID